MAYGLQKSSAVVLWVPGNGKMPLGFTIFSRDYKSQLSPDKCGTSLWREIPKSYFHDSRKKACPLTIADIDCYVHSTCHIVIDLTTTKIK
jgi:hypothetical protein